jgi:ring-1,2-phenylacetyl-CoA epoxidase subunit PaaC
MTAAVATTDQALSHDEALFDYCLRLGDNALILGQHLAEWTSNAPTLELDIALGNQALDLFGQARMLLGYAGRVEGRGRSEDDIAFLRDVLDFRNALLVEQPNGDFGQTVMRQFLYGSFASALYERLSCSKDEELAGIAQKAVKEMGYHARHNGEWVVRLGDGTEESHARAQAGLDALWPYVHELFVADQVDLAMAEAGVGVDPSTLKEAWLEEAGAVIARATLTLPETDWQPAGGKQGHHSEHLGYMLADLQFLQRTYPGAQW